VLSVSSGCSSDDDDDLLPVPVSYTTLIYMIADNSMDSEVEYTINQLKQGAKHSSGTAVVYVDRMNESPRLFKISQAGEEIALKSYEEENSASTETLLRTIKDMKESVPAEKYGLVLWSHSMGWLPSGYDSDLRVSQVKSAQEFPRTRYIGPDFHPGNDTADPMIEINQLANALPDRVVEYIWFDVCLMGSVEAFYGLRNKCNYLIASPSEVLAEAGYEASGIPYSKVLPYMFGGKDELTQACQAYYSHYNNMGYEILRSATITLVDAAQLDGLYTIVHSILGGHQAEFAAMDTNGLQIYHTKEVPPVFFDFQDAIERFHGQADASLDTQLAKAVIFKAATSKFKDVTIDPAKFSGLSMYIPLEKWKGNYEYTYYFDSFEWSGIYMSTK